MSAADQELLDSFERAVEEEALTMLYQPKVDLADGRLACLEALMRWDHPHFGQVEPSRFIPLAEEHGLIDSLTAWGLRTTLRQWLAWKDQGFDTCIAFNISAVSLHHLDFPDLVERMCRALAVPADRLVLELTEGATQPLVKLMDTLTRFRIKGIGLAVDDFGTGYSSLMLLRQLPFTEVKIDRFFVADCDSARDSRLIVEAIVTLARGLGLTATAEGIETPEELRLLRGLGCDVGQGYLFSAPLKPDEVIGWSQDFAARWPDLSGEPRKRRARAGNASP